MMKIVYFIFTFLLLAIEAMTENYYDILQLQRDCSKQEIKRSFRALSLKYHPDKYPGDLSFAKKKFQEIQKAYETLSNDYTKSVYDFYDDAPDLDHLMDYFRDIQERHIPELYAFKEGVTILFSERIDALSPSNSSWVVTFYHPQCGGCKAAVGSLVKAGEVAESNGENIRIGTVNCGAVGGTCRQFGVRHYGSIFIFPPGTSLSSGGFGERDEYEGPVGYKEILRAVKKVASINVHPIESVASFEKRVMQTPLQTVVKINPIESMWLVLHHGQDCPPCQTVKRALRKMVPDLQDSIKVAFLDCDAHECRLPYLPFLQIWIRRKGSTSPEKVELDFDFDSYSPAHFAAEVLVQITQRVMGLKWREVPEVEGKRGDDL